MRNFKKHVTFLVTLFSVSWSMNQLHAQNAESTVQANLNAYNARDIETFMNYFTDDVKLVNFSDSRTIADGKPAVRKLYTELFEQSPKLHSTILKRIVMGNKVIDHESITGRKGSAEAVELIMIYEVKEDKIFRMTVVRPAS